MIKIIKMLFLIVMFLPSTAYPAPIIGGVSGTFDDGETITISSTGTNFGSHPDYHANVSGKLAWLYQDFETALEYDGLALTDAYESWWNRLESGGRSGYWAYRTNQGNVEGLQTSNDSFSTGIFFISYWCYLPASRDNGKTVRFRFNNQAVDYWYNLTGGNVASDTPSAWTEYGVLSSVPSGSWFRIDMLLTNSPQTQKFWIVGANSNNPVYSDTKSITVNSTAELNLGAGYDSSTGYWGYDDVYADFTQARVELCNSSTWSARSHCEIQVPVLWSASSISIDFNTGSFSTDDTAYLYVVDSSGDVSAASEQITIGSAGSDTTPPSVSGNPTIGTDGTTLTIGMTETVTRSGGTFDVDCTTAGSDITATYSSGSGSSSLVYTLGTEVLENDTCNLDYDGASNGIEDAAGNDLASFSNDTITNNSTQTAQEQANNQRAVIGGKFSTIGGMVPVFVTAQ